MSTIALLAAGLLVNLHLLMTWEILKIFLEIFSSQSRHDAERLMAKARTQKDDPISNTTSKRVVRLSHWEIGPQGKLVQIMDN